MLRIFKTIQLITIILHYYKYVLSAEHSAVNFPNINLIFPGSYEVEIIFVFLLQSRHLGVKKAK